MFIADMMCPSDMDCGSEIKDCVHCNAGAGQNERPCGDSGKRW